MPIGPRMAWVFAATAAVCSVTTAPRNAEAADEQKALRYGFRHDPMKWVRSDKSLQGALVRTLVFMQPGQGDGRIIDAEIRKILSGQKADGSFGEKSDETGGNLLRLLELGIARDRPEVKRAADALLRQKRKEAGAEGASRRSRMLSLPSVKAMCLLGRSEGKQVRASLDAYAGSARKWSPPWVSCPWHQEIHWQCLWAGRSRQGVEAAVNDAVRAALKGLNAAGTDPFNSPAGYLDAAGQIDSPPARALVLRLVPLILRWQRPDGGWGDRRGGTHDTSLGESVSVFRALKAHALFDRLRKLPPLPADWKIARSIPAPEGDLGAMTWDGRRLWVYRTDAGEAVALSGGDGKVLRRIRVPPKVLVGICWWRGSLLGAAETPTKRLLLFDPATGERTTQAPLDRAHWVNAVFQRAGRIWIYDAWDPVLWSCEPDRSALARAGRLAGRAPDGITAAGDAVWHHDAFADCLLKSDPTGKLLDWGENPFDEAIGGLAWDGKRLWALDRKGKRICVLVKNAPAN